jgi:hypothetical protein
MMMIAGTPFLMMRRIVAALSISVVIGGSPSAARAEVGESAIALAQVLGGEDEALRSAWLRELISLAGRAALEDAAASERSLYADERLPLPAQATTIDADVFPEHIRAALNGFLDALAPPNDPVRSAVLQRVRSLYVHPADLPRLAIDTNPAYRAAFRDAVRTTRKKADSRIFNGQRAGWDQFTGVVAITDLDGGLRCSGTLVSHKHVVTAAHCLCREAAMAVNPEELMVAFGIISSAMEPIPVARIPYNQARCEGPRTVTWQDGDIALLELAFRVPDDDSFTFDPVDLVDSTSAPAAGQPAIIVGFGRTENDDRGEFKNFAKVVVISSNCTEKIMLVTGDSDARTEYQCSEQIEMVALGIKREDTCDGDSGGPIFVGTDSNWEDGKDSALLRLAGVTSRPSRGGCGSGGIYTRITDIHRQRIQAHLQ